MDQTFWAHRLAELGAAPLPVPKRKLTAERLAHAITEATSNTAYAPKKGTPTLGRPARSAAAVVPAPQWWTTVATRGNSQSCATSSTIIISSDPSKSFIPPHRADVISAAAGALAHLREKA